MKKFFILLFTAFSQFGILELHAEDFKHRSIQLRANHWNIVMSQEGDLFFSIGSDVFDVAVVYKDIYSYEQFYKEVVEVMDAGSDPTLGVGTVAIAVTPMDPMVLHEPHMPADPNHAARTDPLLSSIYYRYEATELWNGLLKKLLPAMDAVKPDRVDKMLELYPPFKEMEGGEKFMVPKMRPIFFGKREEKIARIMASLTPEQLVALGHPAEYSPLTQNEDMLSTPERTLWSESDVKARHSEGNQTFAATEKPALHWIWIAAALLLSAVLFGFLKMR